MKGQSKVGEFRNIKEGELRRKSKEKLKLFLRVCLSHLRNLGCIYAVTAAIDSSSLATPNCVTLFFCYLWLPVPNLKEILIIISSSPSTSSSTTTCYSSTPNQMHSFQQKQLIRRSCRSTVECSLQTLHWSHPSAYMTFHTYLSAWSPHLSSLSEHAKAIQTSSLVSNEHAMSTALCTRMLYPLQQDKLYILCCTPQTLGLMMFSSGRYQASFYTQSTPYIYHVWVATAEFP